MDPTSPRPAPVAKTVQHAGQCGRSSRRRRKREKSWAFPCIVQLRCEVIESLREYALERSFFSSKPYALRVYDRTNHVEMCSDRVGLEQFRAGPPIDREAKLEIFPVLESVDQGRATILSRCFDRVGMDRHGVRVQYSTLILLESRMWPRSETSPSEISIIAWISAAL